MKTSPEQNTHATYFPSFDISNLIISHAPVIFSSTQLASISNKYRMPFPDKTANTLLFPPSKRCGMNNNFLTDCMSWGKVIVFARHQVFKANAAIVEELPAINATFPFLQQKLSFVYNY